MSDDEQQGDEWKRDEQGRFGKGNKGGGRPPGRHTPSLMAALRRKLRESEGEDGRSLADDIAQEMIQRALNGDARILGMMLDRLEGPVKQQIEHEQVIIERVDHSIRRHEDDDDE